MSATEKSSPDSTAGDALTPAELRAIRKTLEREAARLRRDIAVAAREFGSDVSEFFNGTGDEVVDVGTLMVELSEGSTLASNEIDILAQCERALARIKSKTYGTCEHCKNPIAKERLTALPRATHCVTCRQSQLVY